MSDAATQKIINEIKSTREELTNAIFASETRLLLKLEELNNRVLFLENNNQKLEEKVEKLERQIKQNNIIIYGLREKPEVVTSEFVCHTLNQLLEVDIRETDINNCYRLGKTENCPIKVEFVSNLKKQLIFKNIRKLKGGAVAISQDLTSNQRSELKILKKYLVRARGAGKRSFIKGNRLIVDGESYEANELETDEDGSIEDPSERRGNSLPSTPTQELIRTISPEPAGPNPSTLNTTAKNTEKPNPRPQVILASMKLRSNSQSTSTSKVWKRK